MNVCVLTDKFAPHPGGTSVVWTEWCRRWPAENVRVITRQFEGWERFDRSVPFEVHRVPFFNVPKLRMPALWLSIFLKAWWECRRRPPDLLHCAQILETGAYAPWLGVPYAVHTYGEELAAYSRRRITRRLMQHVLRHASAVTTISRHTEQQLRDLLGYQGAVLRVCPGVDTTRFVPGDRAAARQRLGLTGQPVLVTLSRLMERKGHDVVLEILPELRTQFPELVWYVAGTGPYEAELRRRVARGGLQQAVRFLGVVSADDQVALLQAADLFVHPNRELPDGDVEGFGIVFLEAAACGVPVVAGRSGGTPDAVNDGENGLLVDGRDRRAVLEALRALLSDETRRQRMGSAGREWASRFSWDVAAMQVWQWCEARRQEAARKAP